MTSNSGLLALLIMAATLVAGAPASAQSPEQLRSALFEMESESHQLWWRGDVAALDDLMADEFHFVVMNGAIETKEDVVGTGRAPQPGGRPLQVKQLEVQPQQLILRGNSAIVISMMHIDATARGRPLPNQMRVLSVFTRPEEGTAWKLIARSITPLLAPPGAPPPGSSAR